jgi:hypothetical protein
MELKEMRDVVLTALALLAVLYIMVMLGQHVLASFLAFAGVTAIGARLTKYKLQLEVFDAVMYIGGIIIAFSLLYHTATLLGYASYLPIGLSQFAGVASALVIPIMIYNALVYAQHPTKPGYYAWMTFLAVMDTVMGVSAGGKPIAGVQPVIYLVVGVAMLSLALGGYLGLKLSLSSFTGIVALLVFFVGVSLGVSFINASGFYYIYLPSWFNWVSSAMLLGMVLFLFIAYLVERTSATPFLAGAAIWALSVYGATGLTMLINLALFSIAVWVILQALGARK